MSKTLTTVEEIKNWAATNNMKPATVHNEDTGNDTSLLRFMDSDNDKDLHPINWEHFSELFAQNNLALIVEEDSKFNKFVSRENTD
jgi:hypothetical protein